MNVKIIKTEAEYESALRRLDELMDSRPGTPEGDELELWALLIADYEEAHHPIAPPDAVEAIRFRMDQLGLRPVDLALYLGGRSRVSEILNGRRSLSISMIVTLHERLGIPLESLLPTTGKADCHCGARGAGGEGGLEGTCARQSVTDQTGPSR